MRTVLDHFEGAARADGDLVFPNNERWTWQELFEQSGKSAAWFAYNVPTVKRIAIEIAADVRTLAALVGAWRCGKEVVSLPSAPRGEPDPVAWQLALASKSEAELLISGGVLGERGDALSPGKIARTGPFTEELGSLIQFSSGSTGYPTGFCFGLEALAHHTQAICERLRWQRNDVYGGWLPLSHDMGLIGMFLTTACGACSEGGGGLVLQSPLQFVRSPLSWVQALSAERATITASPDFGWRLAARFAHRARRLDLSALRVGISGAEPISAATLRAFSSAYGPYGWSGQAFACAYGLAEAGVGVTLSTPQTGWSSKSFDAAALANGDVEERSDAGIGSVELVSSGEPLDGILIRAGTERLLDTIRVRSRTVPNRCIGGSLELTNEGWLTTSDYGWVDEKGALWVVGREDDLIVTRGQKFWVRPLERLIGEVHGVKPGTVCAIQSDGGTWNVVCEIADDNDAHIVARNILTLCGRSGTTPDAVIVVARGEVPRTASGKPMRRETKLRIDAEQLTPLCQMMVSG